MDTKTCTKCGIEKTFDKFYKQKGGRGGVRRICKMCVNLYDKQRPDILAHRAKRKIEIESNLNELLQNTVKVCTNCGQEKPKTEFHKDKNSPDGLHCWCRTCSTVYNKVYNQTHRAKRLASTKKWQRQNPELLHAQQNRRRCRKVGADGTATAKQIQDRWEVYGSCCYLCGKPAEATDHVIPLAKGGSNWPANLRPVCSSCNSRKSQKWPYIAAMIPMIPSIGGTGLDTVSQVCYNGSR